MKVLVINTGSSSLKYQLFDMSTEKVLAKGGCERIGIEGSFIKHKCNGQTTERVFDMPNHKVAIKAVLEILCDKQVGAISNISEIVAFGHRFVHGNMFTKPVVATKDVIEKLWQSVDYAPLHMVASLNGCEACMAVAPSIPNVFVFDTSFHSTMPAHAYRYAISKDMYQDYGIRKFGFHGTSHRYVSGIALDLLNNPENSKIVTCHIGNGSSVTAVKDGKCIDTSMGFTPLAGVVMGTRSGDVDPAILEFIMKKKNWTIAQTTTYLNKQCGMLGVGGSSDARDIVAKMKTDEDAKLAFELVCYSVLKYVGAYVAALNGVDAIVFTAGLGENCPELREYVLDNLDYLGVKYDKKLNYETVRKERVELSTKDSKVKVFVIATDEELVIAQDTLKLVTNSK